MESRRPTRIRFEHLVNEKMLKSRSSVNLGASIVRRRMGTGGRVHAVSYCTRTVLYSKYTIHTHMCGSSRSLREYMSEPGESSSEP